MPDCCIRRGALGHRDLPRPHRFLEPAKKGFFSRIFGGQVATA
ncbi:hypothetical protein [Sorangium sp. So ce854]